MIARDLHVTANRLLSSWGLLDDSGLLKEKNVRIDRIIEKELGYAIVGAESKGSFRLPKRKLGAISISDKLIFVRQGILDSDSKTAELRHILCHEVSHSVLHAEWLSQQVLPGMTSEENEPLSFAFSLNQHLEQELEANTLAALILIPVSELIVALTPVIETFLSETRSSTSSRLLDVSAKRYQKAVLPLVCNRFDVPRSLAKVVLAYWGALETPRQDWMQIIRNEHVLMEKSLS